MKNSIIGTDAGRVRDLMDTALGRQPADMVVINARLLNVFTGERLDGWGVCVKSDRIAYAGPGAVEMIGDQTRVIDADEMTLIPGFIDGHTHIASGFPPEEFLKHAMTGGTTTVVTEVFEPYFAAGLAGVLDFLAACSNQPIKILATAPAMVSISRLSAGIDRQDLETLLARPDIVGLGESYWQGVLQDPDRYLPAFEATRKAGKTLEGHTAGAGEQKLAAYLASGISSCHEPITAEEALSRLRQGLCVMIREGSVRRDLEAVAKIREKGVDLRRAALVSDGITPEALVQSGYMEALVQKAIDLGFAPVDAVRMATLNAAEHFGLDTHVGCVAPGRYADFLLVPDLGKIRAECVVSNGRVIAQNGKPAVSPRPHAFSEASRRSVHLPRDFDAADFAVRQPDNGPVRRVRAMEMVTDLVTREKIIEMPVSGGLLAADPGNDLAKVAAINRRQDPGRCFTGFIKGFGIRTGAFAASGAWDTSDIIVAGADDRDMAAAVNRIRRTGGGVVAARDGRVEAELPMPVFGVISDLPMNRIIACNRALKEAARRFGIGFADPVLSLMTLTSAAIPFLRICELGLVDLKTGKTLDLFV